MNCEGVIAKRISDTISTMRFPLLLMVVLIHSSLSYKIGAQGNNYIAANVMYFISYCVCSIAVPSYFMMSGYLFFGIMGKTGKLSIREYGNKLYKRIFRLLIPYILWNLLGFVMMTIFVTTPLKSFFPGLSIEINFQYFLSCFWSVGDLHSFFQTAGAPVDAPMWFIRDLIILSVLSPVIALICRTIKFWILIPLTVLFILGIWPHIVGFSLTGILFFMYGAYFSISECKLIPAISRFWWTPIVAILVFLVETWIHPNGYPYIHSLSILTGSIAFVYIAYQISKNDKVVKTLSSLGNLGFFIFAFHMLISSEIATIICRTLSPSTNLGWLGCYLLDFLTLIFVPAILYLATKKVFPGILSLLVGTFKPAC